MGFRAYLATCPYCNRWSMPAIKTRRKIYRSMKRSKGSCCRVCACQHTIHKNQWNSCPFTTAFLLCRFKGIARSIAPLPRVLESLEMGGYGEATSSIFDKEIVTCKPLESFPDTTNYEEHIPLQKPQDIPLKKSTRYDTCREADTSRRLRIFPPPLSSLARKLPSQFPSQLPLVVLQPIRSHGRFVLQELKVPKQLMFRPIRKNGRLILQLKYNEGEFKYNDNVYKYSEDEDVPTH